MCAAPSRMKKKSPCQTSITKSPNLLFLQTANVPGRGRTKTYFECCYFVIQTLVWNTSYRKQNLNNPNLIFHFQVNCSYHNLFSTIYHGGQMQAVWRKLCVSIDKKLLGGLFASRIFHCLQTIQIISSVNIQLPGLNTNLSKGSHVLCQSSNCWEISKDLLSSLLTHFIHSILVTRHLMWQRDAAVQVSLALWPQ